MILALYTFGQFLKPADDPANDAFHAINDPIFARLAEAPGFIGHAAYEDAPGHWDGGPQVWPRWYVERGDGWAPATLSLWRGGAAARAFTEGGLHGVAMARARDWFAQGPWPGHAAWWVPEAHRPGWPEAILRYEHLADHGPTEHAFRLADRWADEPFTSGN